MKKLGLVGGMGSESTIRYYHDIVYGVQNKVGKKFFPNMTIVKEETLSAFMKIIQRMKVENGIQAIILGCTELPLLFKGVKTPVDCLDTIRYILKLLLIWL